MMCAHGAAVVRGSYHAAVVVDMPFGAYEASPQQAFESASRVLKETSCDAIKLEGGVAMAETVAFLTQRGIPVMGHVGLTPQAVNVLGGYNARGRSAAEAEKIVGDARGFELTGNSTKQAIVENFFGQTMMTTTCDACKFKGVRFEPWMMLKCPIPTSGPATIHDCIGLLLKSETVEDYNCDECKTRSTATRESYISRLPLHLIISFKRFENSTQKLRTRVTVDLENTDMRQWIAFPGVLRNASPSYRAYGIVEHHGVSRGGHYIAYTKHNEGWLTYDDTSITPADPATIINTDTYVLLLTRKEYETPPLFTKDK
jgi:hypothetical protein